MAFNLLNTVSGLFNNDLIGRAASSLGESEGSIQKAIGGLVPSVLTGLLNKASSGGGTGASGILDMAKQAASSGILGNLSGLLGGSSGGGSMSGLLSMAGSLFGDKLGNVTSLISNYAGIKSSSASSLLNLTAPAALGTLGKYANENNLNSGGLLSFLNTQKDSILSAIPSGLGLASALGLGSLSDIGNKLSGAVSNIAGGAKQAAGTAADAAKSGSRWLLPLLLILLAIAAIWYFMRGCNKSDNSVTPVDTTATAPATVDTTAKVAAPPARETMKVTLPDGSVLDAYPGGIEDRLVAFLNTDWAKLGADSLKKTWFDFDNLTFETGSAQITPESQKQVNNLAAIVKAYPKAKFKVGGYTDKTGDAAANKKLSQDRAKATTDAIKAAGANGAQLLAPEGYGSQFATVPANASDEERKKDRRISISVREK